MSGDWLEHLGSVIFIAGFVAVWIIRASKD